MTKDPNRCGEKGCPRGSELFLDGEPLCQKDYESKLQEMGLNPAIVKTPTSKKTEKKQAKLGK